MDHLLIPVITLHLSIVAKKHSIATITKLRSSELLIKTPLLHILYYINGFTHGFWTRTGGWEFDHSHGAGTSSPPHWQQRRNLWVGRCVSSWWPWFPSRNSVLIYMYIYICVHSLYEFCYRSYINGSVIQYWRSCTPSRSIGECAVPDLNAILCFLWFTNCVLLFDNNLILGCLWHCVFV